MSRHIGFAQMEILSARALDLKAEKGGNFLFSRHHLQHFDRLSASLKDLQIKRD
jgi:hypothetical protein